MILLEKLTEYLLGKNGVLTLFSFVVSVIISLFIPDKLYTRLPFDDKTNIIIGFVCIVIIVFLVLYFLILLVSKCFFKSRSQKRLYELRNIQTEEQIEKWRVFFDKISDDEYSIIMYFIKTQNKKTYREWGYRLNNYGASIFNPKIQNELFYCTTSYEPGPKIEGTTTDGTKKKMRIIGDSRIYSLKPEMYELFLYIYNKKGSLSHHNRKLVKLRYNNDMEDENE